MSLRMLSKLVPTLALAAVALVMAVPASAAGDAARGKVLGYTCLGCHGIDTYKNVYPTFSVPRLRGQHAEYLAAALQEYAAGQRSHATMHAQASKFSPQDMADVTAYLAGTAVASASAQTSHGTVPAPVTTLCQSCHGLDGVGISPQYPTLSGQHADYIEHALEGYRNGSRKDPIMGPFAQQLKPEQIKEVAEYYSRQRPSLRTVPRPEIELAAAK